MEQVADNHGDGIKEIRVTCVDGLLRSPPDIEPPQTFKEFYEFPELCGWQINEDFTITAYDPPRQSQIEQFRGGEPIKHLKQLSKAFLIQAWLFFGLIRTIVQIDNKPIISFDGLHKREQLSTAELHNAIKKWTEWEAMCQDTHKKGQRFRLIQVGWVLELARQVIRKGYAYYPGEDADAHDDIDESLQNQEQVHPGDRTVLVIMCLGETLSAAKARIVKQNNIDSTGWHSDDEAGWGPPKTVFTMMEVAEWCPRTMEILRGQVSSNATMFVSAYQAYYNSGRMKGGHKGAGCTAQECKLKSVNEKGEYRNRHKCKLKDCELLGPPQDKIVELLRQEDNIIPLLKLVPDAFGRHTSFEVIEFRPGLKKPEEFEFVTVSHVWSDGWGNEKENKLNRCQLEFISRQISRATDSRFTPFWMDTLVIPVAEGQEIYRKKGIRQIFDVFSSSSHTIVLDNGLSDMDRGSATRPAEAAMKIFASIWMRRLWTLQEAYLSNRLLIPFAEENNANNLVDFDKLERELESLQGESTSGVIQMIKVQLSRTIMGEERRLNNGVARKERREKILKEKAAEVVANAYRAARWRTTAKPEHEVLALATLLKLEIKNTTIEEAGLDPAQNVTDASHQSQTQTDVTRPGSHKNDPNRLEDLVCEFWELLHKQRKGAIPSGMIFLPGDKVSRKGFGWAPRTWLSAYDMDYPDPLNVWNKPTDLSPAKGLSVHYHGFLLHPDSISSRGRILGTSIDPEPFSFPVDRSLNEWYSIQRIDDAVKGPLNEITRQEREQSQLAIILSGSSLPRESPKEIALLVEVIDKETGQISDETLDRTAVDYHCSIIHRVLVWRNPDPLRETRDKQNFKAGYPSAGPNEHICIGEVTGQKQRWWVDRPAVIKTENLPAEKQEEEEFEPKPLVRRDTLMDKAKKKFWGVWAGGYGQ